MRRMVIAVALLAGGCSNAPNHLGHPLFWPVAVSGTAAGNAVYGARRALIKSLLSDNADALRAGDARASAVLLARAGVPPQARARVQAEIMALPPGPDCAEQATIIVMVHS